MPCNLVIRSAQRLDYQQIRIFRGQHDPVTTAQRDELAGLQGRLLKVPSSDLPEDIGTLCDFRGEVILVVIDPDLVAARHDGLALGFIVCFTAGSSCGVPSQKTQIRGS
jgi:hypothetical protein